MTTTTNSPRQASDSPGQKTARHSCAFVSEHAQLTDPTWQQIVSDAENVTLVALDASVVDACKATGATVMALPDKAQVPLRAPRHHTISYRVYEWLKSMSFDHVHFPADGGPGYFALLARHQGVALQSTDITVNIHEPVMWKREQAREYVDQIADIEKAFMERRCVELADDVTFGSEAVRAWVDDQGWVTGSEQPSAPAGLPKISVCLTHYNRASYLRQTLDSLKKQDYEDFEVILVDDGSTDSDAVVLLRELEADFKERGWTLARQQNQYVGVARNHAASLASGEYILFMDDDNVAKPHEISTFARVASQTDADLLTCFCDEFTGSSSPIPGQPPDRRRIWLGGPAAAGLFRSLGDANALIRRSTFHDVGGYAEEKGIAKDDRELFVRVLLARYQMEVIPEALFWYRYDEQSISRIDDIIGGEYRILRAYQDAAPEAMRDILSLAHGLKKGFKTSATPQDLIDELWNSPSWRLTRPFRNITRRLRGLGHEETPIVYSRREAQKMAEDMRRSASWEWTGPLRAIAAFFRGAGSDTWDRD